MMSYNKYSLLWVLLFIGIMLVPEQSHTQIRSGLGYLKLSPGARQVGISGSLAGTLDYTDSFYANPGAAGLLREWQWSASYTNWISDVYNASFLLGRQFRTPWSRWTKFVFGISYLGIPEFDSSEGASPLVSGNNLLTTVTFGQPLSMLSDNLSFGTNVKYFRSELAQFDANAIIWDVGLLYRTPRFAFITPGNGFLDHGIFSAGLSVTNIGKSVTFVSEGTPLPKTLRAGFAFNLGSHDGLQWSLASDYHLVRDENGFITFGSEVSWSQLVSLRLGYSFEDNILGHFTFGASLRLDDQFSPVRNTIPGRNNALRFDLAANQNSDFTSSPFHGSATHFPIGPEQFRSLEPAYGAIIKSDSLTLAWEYSLDRDLFDSVNYWLLIDRDSLKLVQVQEISADGDELFVSLLEDKTFVFNQQLSQTHVSFDDFTGGEYFWSVFAYDNDRHIRFADIDKGHIGRFIVTSPDLQITDINFEYSPWITQDDYQGVLKFQIANLGERAARNFSFSVFDSSAVQLTSKNGEPVRDEDIKILISQTSLTEIKPGGFEIIDVPWSTKQAGLHEIIGELAIPSRNSNADEITAWRRAAFYTIPKGSFATYDTVLTQSITNINYELPYVGKVFFDSSSADIRPRFIRSWVIEPLLITLADRLKENQSFRIFLQGTADLNSSENDVELADARARAVRDSVLNLGVSPEQIEILPGTLLPVRNLPKNPEDARWILQERRRVEITVDESTEKELFRPLQANFSERVLSPVTFSANIRGVVPFQSGFAQLKTDGLLESFNISDSFTGANVRQNIYWQYRQTDINSEDDWRDTDAKYMLALTDSLNRNFQTRPRQVYLKTTAISRERMYFGVAKFALAEPLYNFYWANLLERIPYLLEKESARLRFIGHACAIGPEPINLTLSRKRAQVFYDRFLKDVKEQHPELYEQIKLRVDAPEGFGETQPFTFKGRKGEIVLLGDNEVPTGRQLNRRVIALIYSKE